MAKARVTRALGSLEPLVLALLIGLLLTACSARTKLGDRYLNRASLTDGRSIITGDPPPPP